MKVLEDMDLVEINFDGVAIEERMQNEGVAVVEDTNNLEDNPAAVFTKN